MKHDSQIHMGDGFRDSYNVRSHNNDLQSSALGDGICNKTHRRVLLRQNVCNEATCQESHLAQDR